MTWWKNHSNKKTCLLMRFRKYLGLQMIAFYVELRKTNSTFIWKNEIPNFIDLFKTIMFFPYFFVKKTVSDIKTYSKNIIKLDSIFVFSSNFFPTKRHLFYWLCLSRYIYSMTKRTLSSLQICKTFVEKRTL